MAALSVNLVITQSAGKESIPAAVGAGQNFILVAAPDLVTVCPAINRVGTGIAVEPVAAFIAVHFVIAIVTVEPVVPGATMDFVVATLAVNGVRGPVSKQKVLGSTGLHSHLPTGWVARDLRFVSCDDILTLAAVYGVGARAAVDFIISVLAVNGVVAGIAK